MTNPPPSSPPPAGNLKELLLNAPIDAEFAQILDDIVESRGFGPLASPPNLDAIARALAKLDDAQLTRVGAVVDAERRRRNTAGEGSC